MVGPAGAAGQYVVIFEKDLTQLQSQISDYQTLQDGIVAERISGMAVGDRQRQSSRNRDGSAGVQDAGLRALDAS